MFGDRRYYRQLLGESEEGIASNMLSDRLKRLAERGLVTKQQAPTHRQWQLYSLTEQSIHLVPVIVQLGTWGRKFLPVGPELSIRAKILEDGGPQLWEDFMDELRIIHLGAECGPDQESVMGCPEPAYREVRAEKISSPG